MSVFDQAEDATDPNQDAAGVQRVQTPLPQLVHLHALSCGDTHHASVEDPSSHDKAGEEEDLDHQTTDNHVLTQSHGIEAAGCHDAAAFAKLVLSLLCERLIVLLPAPCIRKDITSPTTKILVNHFPLIIECCSPSVIKIILPRHMYMLAAKTDGATRTNIVCVE